MPRPVSRSDARSSRPRPPRPHARLLALPLAGLVIGVIGAGGCALTRPHVLESRYATVELPRSAEPVHVGDPVDARRFTDASNRAPVPSVEGDPDDTTITARTVGRRLVGTGMLGPNVMLPPGESVAGRVREAIVSGLRRAALGAVPAAGAYEDTDRPSPRLDVTVQQLWLDVKPSRTLAVIEYRARIEIEGDWPRFREGRTIEARGTVSAAGLDMTLWRRAFDRALEEIAAATTRAARADAV